MRIITVVLALSLIAFASYAAEVDTVESRIVFVSNQDGDFDIFVMDADGSNIVNIINGLGLINGVFWWVPRSPEKDKMFTYWGWIKS